MRIGTDVSLKTCMDEGYTVMDFEVRKLYPRGRKNGIDKDYQARFSASFPDYIRKEMGCQEDPFGMRRAWDTTASWNDLLELYKYNPGVDECCGIEPGSRNMDNPTEWDMLKLAADLNSYCGLG